MSLFGKMYPWSKWRKHEALWEHTELRPHLPETAKFTHEQLLFFLDKYPVVFLKPCYGGGGRGVIKLSHEGEWVRVQTLTDRKNVTIDNLYGYIVQIIGKKSYVIQQGIDLLDIQDRKIDFRVLLLKPRKTWMFMGSMGKLGVKGQVVTNHCRGGKSIIVKNALQESTDLKSEEIDVLENKLHTTGQQIALALEKRYPLITELGLDMGIDRERNVWLIEANTRPQYNLFKHHKDPALYNKIRLSIHRLRSVRPRYPNKALQTRSVSR
ncbi:YheC/YheD family protein [Paenibacillus allorhizosphaerae]|uniref:Endospore coat-associated protein YheD n=1 Tax=Paenibacillus allorhizosphaerae TaxID=2849866 RepID=A0ABN7TL71_9BACL|nr:YheC/YheD family protein [Paenibacillus allorhizosphaerae]CAG7645221.1 Endospore coat-associated protein YheD [Paenibacillus allorhizosphaerae]